MCCKTQNKCTQCMQGYSVLQNRLSFAERRCCSMCDTIANPDDPKEEQITAFQERVADYQEEVKQGQAKHNPCNMCGANNKCGKQIRENLALA